MEIHNFVFCSIISEIIEKAQSSLSNIATDDVKSILKSIVERDDVDEKEKKSTLIDFVAAGVLTVGIQTK